MKSLTRFITTKLKLKVNEQKSAVARPWERKFLGFSFTSAKTSKRRIAPKAVSRFKERVRELTSRTRGEHRAGGRGAGPLFTGLDRLLRKL
jgi:RNA-directed DNA polymerase